MPDHLEPDQPQARNLTREIESFQLDLERERKRRFWRALAGLVGIVALLAGCVWLWGCSAPDRNGPFEVIQPHPKPVEDPPPFCVNGECRRR